MDITVTEHGPFFDGTFSSILDDIVRQAQEQVAQQALERVQFFLNAQIKHPTPYYETQITRQRVGDHELVHDRGIVYGPWLEGTSRRNSTTRFKGYASFRKAAQAVQALAPDIVSRVVARNIGRLQ